MEALIYVLLGLFVLFEILAVPVLLILVLTDRSRTTQRLEALARRFKELEARLAAPTTAPIAAAAPETAPAPAAAPAAPVVAPEAAPATPPAAEVVPPTEIVAPPIAAAAETPPAAAPEEPVSAGVASVPPPPTRPPRGNLEERLMRTGIVCLGGVALSLGAAFLVKYSVDQGWFGPVARVLAGGALGLVLWAAAEWVRRRDQRTTAAFAGRQNIIPPALAASGSVALFASVYGGYALYHLMGPLVAFILLAAVATATVMLSLLHGAVMAWLGLVGVYVVPALVITEKPSAVGLLGYVGIATAGSMALLRWRQWVWLGWVAIAGATLWSLLALFGFEPAELVWPLGILLFVQPLLFIVVADAVGDYPEARLRSPTAWVASGLASLLMWALLEKADYIGSSLGLAFALVALLTAIAWRHARFDRLAWIGASFAAIMIAFWHFEPVLNSGVDRMHLLLVPPSNGAGAYLMLATLLGVLYGIGGFALLWRTANPARWAIVSATTPLLLLAAAYWRLEHFALSLPWAGIALVLAALALGAVELLAPRIEERSHGLALAAYAVAMTAALTLAMTLTLRVGWLTVALALELPALAAIGRRVPSRAFSRSAAILAAVVLVRLLLNPQLRHYVLSTTPIFNELLYLYGVPLLAFVAAGRLFQLPENDRRRWLFDGAAIAVALALVTLETRHLMLGGHLTGPYELAEQGLHSTIWLGVAALLMRYDLGLARRVREVAWQLIAGVAAFNVVLVSGLAANPLLLPINVGTAPIFDALLLAYCLPAALLLVLARPIASRTVPQLGIMSGVLGLGIVFLYVTMEVRHWFVGPILARGEPSDAEWYAYSATWLLYGAALLGLGLVRQAPLLRIAGLVIGGIVAIKAFLFDMAALTGLYRAASFLGLGASMIGLAYLYQRLVARARKAGLNGGAASPGGETAR